MTDPRATYRLQLHARFTLSDAAATADYLADLGVSHVYLSPIAEAAPGSTHGYDGADPTSLDDERGGETGFARLREACAAHALGIVLDIVPNHLDISSPRNRWWQSVLREGRESEAAGVFDIDWNDDEAHGRVVLPVLGEPVEEAVAQGRLRVSGEGDAPTLQYSETSFPLRPGDDGRGEPAAVAARQHYTLKEWRSGAARLNYRRFFDITSLAAVRVEDESVFARTHTLVARLIDEGHIDGLRVDHVDGMRDPEGYMTRLRALAPDRWIIVEKILSRGERLRDEWPVDGTTGYEFADLALGVLVNPTGEAALRATHDRLVGGAASAEHEVFRAKLLAATDLLPAELRRLAREFRAATGSGASDGDVRRAIATLAACFPAYRSYVVPERGAITEADAELINEAVREAARRDVGLAGLFHAMRDLLLLRSPGVDERAAHEFVARFQQYSTPVMAKGVEDTAFYRLSAFVAAHDVGGIPGAFARPLRELHDANAERASRWPACMLTTSTHDTKRSEDVRARLAAMSETPEEWTRLAERWMVWFAGNAPRVERSVAYALLQNLAGAWPISNERARAFARKAAREAKTATSWLRPDEDYERALDRAVDGALQDDEIRCEVERFLDVARPAGRRNSLTLAAMKFLSPGVPDIYQGCDLWDLSLVDPDNRRPVDFALRREMLRRAVSTNAEEVAASVDDPADAGLAKMFLTRLALRVRAERPACFGRTSGYLPLPARGADAERVIAFARTDADRRPGVVLAAPRWNAARAGWGATSVELPAPSGAARWLNRAGGGLYPPGPALASELFSIFPVAILTAEEA